MSNARNSNPLATILPSIDTAEGVREILRRAARGDELGASREVAGYRESRWDRALKRFLAACRTLASVRRLGVPALQINVARRQVNVSGPAS